MLFIESFFNTIHKTDNYLTQFPFLVGLKITGRCNLKCIHCWAGPKGKEISLSEIARIIKELKKIGVIHLNLSGGEPLLRKDILKIISFVKGTGRQMSMGVYTNGILINRKFLNNLMDFWNLNTDFFHISFDSVSNEILYKFRGKSYFETLLKNVELILEYGLKIRLHCTVSYLNVNDLFCIFKKANDIGVNTLSINPMVLFGKAMSIDRKFDSNIFFNQVLKIREYQKKLNTINVRVFMPPEIFLEGALHKLGALPKIQKKKADQTKYHISNWDVFYKAMIDASLNVKLAPYLKDDFVLGNLKKMNFTQLWLKSYEFRKKIFFRDLSNSLCLNCEVFRFCQGGDWVSTLNKYNNLNIESINCFKKKGRKDGTNNLSYE